MDVTLWMDWSLGCLGRAIEGAQTTLAAVLGIARFSERVRDLSINGRQRMILNRLLNGFEGKLTTSKWATIAKCSSDTAGHSRPRRAWRARPEPRSLAQHQLLAR